LIFQRNAKYSFLLTYLLPFDRCVSYFLRRCPKNFRSSKNTPELSPLAIGLPIVFIQFK
jgi:hypothetical protein